jgi:hypothetical protein
VPDADEISGRILAPPMPRRVHVQRGFLAVILVLAALLVLAAGSSFLAARRMTDVLLQGEGEALWHDLREQLPRGRPPTSEELADLLARHRAVGLRYLAIHGAQDERTASAGDTTHPDMPELRIVQDASGRARLKRPLHRGPRGEPPPPHAPPPRGPLHIVLEFEPQIAAALLSRARRDLIVSLAVAAALLVSAAVFTRLQRRARVAEASLLERRHLAVARRDVGRARPRDPQPARQPQGPRPAARGAARRRRPPPGQGPPHRRRGRPPRAPDHQPPRLRARRPGRPRAQPPRALARRALDITDPTRVTVDERTAPEHWSLDPTRIEQALVNLLRNALQASDTPVELSVRREDGGLVFLVADRGPGVPPAIRERLFQPFATGRTQGTGLGLAVVRRVAELHGGTVAAVSRTGGGASFRLWVPPGPETAPPPATIVETE